MRSVALALLLGFAFTGPVLAQTGSSIENADNGTASLAISLGAQTNVATADYVKWSAEAINYRIAASTLAVRRAQRGDVKAFAQAELDGAKQTRATLLAALNNKDRRIAKPSNGVSSIKAASLDLLKKAPAASFDNLYLTQMADFAPPAWSLQKGYADDGADPVLRQIAVTSVPAIARTYSTAKSLMPAGLANAQ